VRSLAQGKRRMIASTQMLVTEREGICAVDVNAKRMNEERRADIGKRYRALRDVTWNVRGRVQSTLRSAYRDRITLGSFCRHCAKSVPSENKSRMRH